MAQWRCAAAFCAVAGVVLPVSARADIEVPERCGGESELRSELERLLGPARAQEAWPERLHIEADDEGGYALELSMRGETRRVRDGDCRALFKSAVVMAAVAVDPSAAERSEQTESGPEAKPEAQPEPEPENDSAPAPLRLSLALGGGAIVGAQPQLAPIAELSAALSYGSLGVSLGGRYLFESRASRGGRAVDIDGIGGRLTALYEPIAVLRFAAGVALDFQQGQGVGAGVTGNGGTGTRVALVAEAEVRPLTFGQLWLAAALSGEFALARPSFEITGYGTVYRVPSLAGALVLRLGWEFL